MQRGRDERGSSGTACVDRHHHVGADGDDVPLGERVFVDNAHSASLEVQLSFPLAPLFPQA
ncbi:MAG TPA: hypothetical protein VN607_07190 [Gemmatimonadaceae bacterium]|nr:hypothetical protein [Gemmatimonadaceae bacterium]